MEDGAFFGFDGLHDEICVELLGGIDYGTAVCESGQEADDEAKAVE